MKAKTEEKSSAPNNNWINQITEKAQAGELKENVVRNPIKLLAGMEGTTIFASSYAYSNFFR